ncbi:MAG: maleylacetate reductase [Woeseiaceae bacterium]|nr:maleylacetate reductase [Woeseiaceae bacterium]
MVIERTPRIVFGSDTVSKLPYELERLACQRALVLSTAGRRSSAENVARLLGDNAAAIFAEAVMHTPLEVTESAMQVVAANDIDCLVAIGGGSTTGLSKAIALRSGLPQIVIATTYAGSEMTPILGQTEGGVKTTLTDTRIIPDTVIYDVMLTLSLPASFSGSSGINAIAHAVEALYARDSTEEISALAVESIGKLAQALPVVIRDPQNLDARSNALAGASLAGRCLAHVGMALHHKLCHTLGGSFDLPHAETHTAVLPHAAAYNAGAAPRAMEKVANALGKASAPQGLFELGKAVKATMALRDLGLREADLDRAAELAVQNPYWNPRLVERDAIRELLGRAWAGVPPQV